MTSLVLGVQFQDQCPTFTFSLIQNHLFRGSRFGAKYFIHDIQKSSALLSVLLIRSLGFTFSSYSGCGGVLCCPNKMSFGVIGELPQILFELGCKGRQLIWYLISVKSVLHCSLVKAGFLHVKFITCLAHLPLRFNGWHEERSPST